MRIVSVVACVAFFAGTGSALAADCNKGMLWPFVRTTGDCLTDVEIASGKTGVYTGPVNSNVDVSAIKPSETPAQSSGVSGSSSGSGLLGGALFGSGGTSDGGDGALITSSSVFGGGTDARPNTALNCNKGTFWPFQREPGDCLTETEKKAGRTGVYGGGPGLTQASAPVPSATPGQGAPAVLAPVPAQPSCQKGWLWPFVRESNDCPSAADKADGKTASAPAVTQVSAMNNSAPAMPANPSTAPAPVPAAAAPACHKGLLWPFVRDAGDCPTDQDKKNSGEK